jgi:hypothetical protein
LKTHLAPLANRCEYLIRGEPRQRGQQWAHFLRDWPRFGFTHGIFQHFWLCLAATLLKRQRSRPTLTKSRHLATEPLGLATEPLERAVAELEVCPGGGTEARCLRARGHSCQRAGGAPGRTLTRHPRRPNPRVTTRRSSWEPSPGSDVRKRGFGERGDRGLLWTRSGATEPMAAVPIAIACHRARGADRTKEWTAWSSICPENLSQVSGDVRRLCESDQYLDGGGCPKPWTTSGKKIACPRRFHAGVLCHDRRQFRARPL